MTYFDITPEQHHAAEEPFLAQLATAGRNRPPLRPALPALAPGLAAFLVAAGVSHFLSGDAYGAPAELPWSIYLWNAYRHPSQVYETLAALLILSVSLKRPLGQGKTGMNFLLVAAFSAAARLFLEAFRGDSLALPGGFRQAQVVSLGVLLLALWLMKRISLTDRAAE
jgi:prolipoprotein diacylglyceryltransferase